jgi:hypothetical protein
MDNQEKHATLSIRQKQNKDEQNKNPTKIQEPQHSKLKRRGTRTPPKYKNHNTEN